MQIADLLDAIENDRSPIVDIYEGKKPVDIVLAAYESQIHVIVGFVAFHLEFDCMAFRLICLFQRGNDQLDIRSALCGFHFSRSSHFQGIDCGIQIAEAIETVLIGCSFRHRFPFTDQGDFHIGYAGFIHSLNAVFVQVQPAEVTHPAGQNTADIYFQLVLIHLQSNRIR